MICQYCLNRELEYEGISYDENGDFVESYSCPNCEAQTSETHVTIGSLVFKSSDEDVISEADTDA